MDETDLGSYVCPWCPADEPFLVPVPPWRTELSRLPNWLDDESTWTLRATRKAWEIPMAEHWQAEHPERDEERLQLLAEVGRDLHAAVQRARLTLVTSLGRKTPTYLTGVRPPARGEGFDPRRDVMADRREAEEMMRGWHGL